MCRARVAATNVLPEADDERGEILLATCLLDYFPNACAAVALHSAKSNDKHSPGQPPHWARDKSTDHRNKIARHLIDAGGFDKDGNRHSVALAWRGLALLEDELIAEGATPGRNAIGSPGNEELDIDWNACFPTRAQREVMAAHSGIPAESAYIASFGPNESVPLRCDVSPMFATLRDIPDSFIDSHGCRITRRVVAKTATTVATSQHPMAAEVLRDEYEKTDGETGV